MDLKSSLIEDSPPYAEVARAFHVANFVPVNWGAQDPVSRSLVDFQFRREPQMTQWIRLALVAAEGLGPVDVVVRALSSREVAAGGEAPLDRLAGELAQRLGGVYAPARLAKTRRTAPVKNAGIREMRDRILRDSYAFDGSGLAGATCILVVDDIVTTGATFGAITAAIRASLPQADIRYFALGRTDPWLVRQHLGEDFSGDPDAYRDSLLGNAHLDPRYFLGAVASAARKTQSAGSDAFSPRALRGREHAEPVASPVVGAVVEAGVEAGPAHVVRPSSPAPLRPQPVRRRSEIPWRAIAVALIAVGIVLVTFILTQTTQEEVTDVEPPPPPAAGSFDAAASASTVQQPARPKPDTRPRGVINVPIVGLRMEPSITSGPVPDAVVRVGEKVIVVRKFKPEVGPEWLYVEIAGRKYGWVIAPVVTLSTGRPATQ